MKLMARDETALDKQDIKKIPRCYCRLLSVGGAGLGQAGLSHGVWGGVALIELSMSEKQRMMVSRRGKRQEQA